MIQRMSHVTLFVNNQDEAKDFYVSKLGFDVRTDHTMESGFRWLTVGPIMTLVLTASVELSVVWK